jgi:2-dehydro-3-deoxy-D-arabinonate dehydratase
MGFLMQLARTLHGNGQIVYGAVQGETFHPFNSGPATLGELLAANDVFALADKLMTESTQSQALSAVTFLAPIDKQEVWAAGVTYKRSKVAREEESKGAAQFYDKVYTAPRPELFLKATPARVMGPKQPVRIRQDSKWNVPEPELTLVISPAMKIVGYTIGNDMSSRDIEGENPLYLPQAKIYNQSCAIGPVITLVQAMPPLPEVEIRLVIERAEEKVFEATTTLSQMARTPEELVDWLGRELSFPDGVFLLTGTGIVPPDDFTLLSGDLISISIGGIGTLENPVA